MINFRTLLFANNIGAKNDHLFISHVHDPKTGGFIYLEDTDDWLSDEHDSSSSVVHKPQKQDLRISKEVILILLLLSFSQDLCLLLCLCLGIIRIPKEKQNSRGRSRCASLST